MFSFFRFFLILIPLSLIGFINIERCDDTACWRHQKAAVRQVMEEIGSICDLPAFPIFQKWSCSRGHPITIEWDDCTKTGLRYDYHPEPSRSKTFDLLNYAQYLDLIEMLKSDLIEYKHPLLKEALETLDFASADKKNPLTNFSEYEKKLWHEDADKTIEEQEKIIKFYRDQREGLFSIIDKRALRCDEIYQEMFDFCINRHANPSTLYSRGLYFFHRGQYLEALEDIVKFIKSGGEITSDLKLVQGSIESELGLYEEAIASLTESLKLDPKQLEAHFERALAYFQIGNFEKSLKDYLDSKEKIVPIQKTHYELLEFSKGLIYGSVNGVGFAIEDVIPSTLSSLYAAGHGLFSFAASPIEVGKNMIEDCKNLVTYLRSAEAKDICKALAPEVGDLALNWDNLTSQDRGQKMGFIIGKYGIEMFASLGTVKGAQLYRQLKKAEALATLEIMAKDAQKAAKLQGISKEWSKKTELVIKQLKKTADSTLDRKLAKTFKDQCLSEAQVRKILHSAGFKTFPRPKGIPINWEVKITSKNGGMKYVCPENKQFEVRVMSGDLNSKWSSQKKPYVVHKIDSGWVSKDGKIYQTDKTSEIHIPLSDYNFGKF